ncbi:hypothetical protein H2204_003415 [Knufia peltigerae]|uniref:Uncharacterized protein n=1 Tax=Knufia peltigerae TaxID=1002370 RepID=A0AA39D1P7_9EURO|nr:hypothetical protein H2204_003415 [Knufia peltigerae]
MAHPATASTILVDREPTFPAIDLDGDFEEDVEECVAFSIPLEDDDLRAGQLGTRIYRNLNETEPRDLITAKESKNQYHFQARFAFAKYGTYHGADACLVVVRVSFQQRSSHRFKSAEIEMNFEDAANVDLNPHEADIDTTHQPKVLDFEPKEFQGPTTDALVQNSLSLSVQVSAPSIPVAVTPGGSTSTTYVKKRRFKIHGIVEDDPPSSLHWVIREDDIQKDGIPSEVKVAMIVTYTPGRKFAARLRLRADVFLPFLRPVCGLKDEPIFFDPEFMQDQAAKKLAVAQGVAPTVPGLVGCSLDRVSLKEITGLFATGGDFGS